MTSKQRRRKLSTLERLEKQLKSGHKPEKIDGKTSLTKKVPLTESDVKRIKKELEVLEKAVV